MGLCYSNIGKYDEAIQMLQKAIQLNPNCSYMHSNLGLQYRHRDKIDDAIQCFEKSLSIEESHLTWGMLGGCYGEKRNLEEAEKCFLKAIEIKPDFANAHVDLANVYHFKGEWEKAWPEYEWRHDVFEQLKIWKTLYDPNKSWTGQSLKGKTIIIHGEQGCGDTIQFSRYISRLDAEKVILHCHDDLATIFDNCVHEVYTEEPTLLKRVDLPIHDYHCSVLSLPYFLNLKEIPPFYLKIDEMVNLDHYSDSFNIGIVWAGNPQHPNDANRSCHLANFREIHDMPGVKLFSLVKNSQPRIYRFNPNPIDLTEGTEDMKIIDMSQFMKTFKDTATIINSLDLIITVDTAVLHLAGSMGKPTWALLPYCSDWRWSQKGNTTVWYPSVRMFRQPSKGDWKTIFSEVRKEIQNEQKYSSR